MTLISVLGPAAKTQVKTLMVGLIVLMAWVSMIIIWPILPTAEGNLLPVVGKVSVSRVTPKQNSVLFYVRFEKYRHCDFIGLTWYKGDVRLTLKFEPDANTSYPTRPTGGQYAGPWQLNGVTSLIGTVATVVHSCHPFWLTYTKFWS